MGVVEIISSSYSEYKNNFKKFLPLIIPIFLLGLSINFLSYLFQDLESKSMTITFLAVFLLSLFVSMYFQTALLIFSRDPLRNDPLKIIGDFITIFMVGIFFVFWLLIIIALLGLGFLADLVYSYIISKLFNTDLWTMVALISITHLIGFLIVFVILYPYSLYRFLDTMSFKEGFQSLQYPDTIKCLKYFLVNIILGLINLFLTIPFVFIGFLLGDPFGILLILSVSSFIQSFFVLPVQFIAFWKIFEEGKVKK